MMPSMRRIGFDFVAGLAASSWINTAPCALTLRGLAFYVPPAAQAPMAELVDASELKIGFL